MNAKLRINFLLLGAALLAASCGGLKISGANIGGSSGPDQPSGDAREDVKKALQNLHDVKSFRARTEANGVTLMEIESVNPDRFHWKVQSLKEGAGAGEIIIIGKDTFINKGNGAWIKSPISMSAMIQQVRDENVEEAMKRREDIKFVGRDVVDGAPTLVYQYRYKLTNKLWKMWISASDWLPRKSESEAGGSVDGPKVTTRITYSDYNSDIRIEPPI